MTTDEMTAVLQAYEKGKTIEFRRKEQGEWCECKCPSWNFDKYYYRIKNEPHYRPFMALTEVDEAILRHGIFLLSKNTSARLCITEYNGTYIWFGCNSSTIRTFAETFEDFTFADGTPFGKLVKE